MTEQQYKKKIALATSSQSLITLVAIQLIVFVIFGFLRAVWYYRYHDDPDQAVQFYQDQVLSWATLPGDFTKAMNQPWSLFSFMFVHDDAWKIIPNLLWLGFFGYVLYDLTGNRKLVPVFLYGSMAGAMAWLIGHAVLPGLHANAAQSYAMGAAPGVMAVAVMTTLVAPDYKLFPLIKGGIPIWVLTILYFASDIAGVGLQDMGQLIFHLAGAVAGMLFIFFLRLGYDGSEWMNQLADWFSNLFNPDRPRGGKKVRDELFYQSKVRPYIKKPNVTRERVDQILDKIGQEGYHFLTDEEKEILKRAGEEDF